MYPPLTHDPALNPFSNFDSLQKIKIKLPDPDNLLKIYAQKLVVNLYFVWKKSSELSSRPILYTFVRRMLIFNCATEIDQARGNHKFTTALIISRRVEQRSARPLFLTIFIICLGSIRAKSGCDVMGPWDSRIRICIKTARIRNALRHYKTNRSKKDLIDGGGGLGS